MSKALSLKQAKALLKIDESKLDKYLRYYSPDSTTHDDLTPTEQNQLEKYRRIFSMFNIGRTDEFVRDVIMKEYGVEWRQARNLVNEAFYIYGVIGEADKEGKKRASINFYRTLSNLAFKNQDLDNAGKLWEKADKLEGLFDADQNGLDPNDFKHAPKFVYVNNINVLNQRRKELDADD
jgi:hypothetical protein